MAQLAQLSLEALVGPARVLPGELQDEIAKLAPLLPPDTAMAVVGMQPIPVGPTRDASAATCPGWAARIARMAWAERG